MWLLDLISKIEQVFSIKVGAFLSYSESRTPFFTLSGMQWFKGSFWIKMLDKNEFKYSKSRGLSISS